jgi:hypothetical protein
MRKLIAVLTLLLGAVPASADLKSRMQAEADASAAMMQAEADRKAIQDLLPRLSHASLRSLRKTAEDLRQKDQRK